MRPGFVRRRRGVRVAMASGRRLRGSLISRSLPTGSVSVRESSATPSGPCSLCAAAIIKHIQHWSSHHPAVGWRGRVLLLVLHLAAAPLFVIHHLLLFPTRCSGCDIVLSQQYWPWAYCCLGTWPQPATARPARVNALDNCSTTRPHSERR